MANHEEAQIIEEMDSTQTTEAINTLDAVEAALPVTAAITVENEDSEPEARGVPEVSDSGIFSVLAIGSALFYLFALVVVMIALRDYSHPERFLRFW